jgi:hypothetical protein
MRLLLLLLAALRVGGPATAGFPGAAALDGATLDAWRELRPSFGWASRASLDLAAASFATVLLECTETEETDSMIVPNTITANKLNSKGFLIIVVFFANLFFADLVRVV